MTSRINGFFVFVVVGVIIVMIVTDMAAPKSITETTVMLANRMDLYIYRSVKRGVKDIEVV